MRKSKNNITNWLAENSNPEQTRRTEKMFELASKIIDIMEETGMNRVQLAEKMGKQPSEISKILSGSHNVTLNTVFAIEEALKKEIIFFSEQKQETKEITKYVYFNIHHFEKSDDTKYEKTKIPVIPEAMQAKVI